MSRRSSLLALLILLLASACGTAQDPSGRDVTEEEPQPAADEAPELIPVRIALPEINSAFINLLVAHHGGIFEAHGLDSELIVVPAPTIAAALASGDVEFTAAAGSTTRAAHAGVPVTMVAATMSGSDYTILADTAVATPQDLAGQTAVTGPPTSTPGVMLTAMLEDLGVAQDVEVLNVAETTARLALLETRQVAAGLINLDGALRLMADNDDLHIVVPPAEFPRLPFTGVGVANDYLAENPDVVTAAIRAMLEAGRLILEDPDRTIELIADALALTLDQATEVHDLMSPFVISDGVPGADLLESDARLNSLTLGEEMTAEQVSATYDLTLLQQLE